MNNLNIHNQSILKLNYNELLKYNIKIPNIQRILNTDKVTTIFNYQLDYYKKYNQFNILGVINIHYVKDTNIYYLIDGQHRYSALEKLYNIGHSPDFFIELVYVDNFDILTQNYNLINTNTVLPELPNNIDKTIIETTAIYFKNKYGDMWSKQARSNRPYIYFDYFLEAVGVLFNKLENINNSQTMIKLIEDYNSKLKNWNKKYFPEGSSISDNMYSKCVKSNFYLGLFKHISDTYRYKWIANIIHEQTGNIITFKKKIIPKKLKIDVWNKYIGQNIRTTKCICCCNKIIDVVDFHAGHIISEKNNGTTSIDNIIPICGDCNKSMGTTNMDIYIKTYYPKNYNNFLSLTDKNYNNDLYTSIYNYWIY